MAGKIVSPLFQIVGVNMYESVLKTGNLTNYGNDQHHERVEVVGVLIISVKYFV